MTNNATYALQDALDANLEASIDTRILERVTERLISEGWMFNERTIQR